MALMSLPINDAGSEPLPNAARSESGPLLREDLATVLDAASAAWFQVRLAVDTTGRPAPWSAVSEPEKVSIRARVFEVLSGKVQVRQRADQAALDVAIAMGSVRVSWRGRPQLLVASTEK